MSEFRRELPLAAMLIAASVAGAVWLRCEIEVVDARLWQREVQLEHLAREQNRMAALERWHTVDWSTVDRILFGVPSPAPAPLAGPAQSTVATGGF